MIVKGTYFTNDEKQSLHYGEVEVKNVKRRRLRNEEEKEGVIAKTVIAGFCGTDNELMKMGLRNELGNKFPKGENRLVNGHEGVVYVPSLDAFKIVLIRGGNAYDPTRYTEEESYFEYGCDGADGLFSDQNYYNEDMLLNIPSEYVTNGKMPLSILKKLVFPDPYACMIFQLERMEDLGVAHLFRVEMAKHKCSKEEGEKYAYQNLFNRTVIFGLGTTGMFMADLIQQNHPNANILFVSRSDESSPKVQFALNKVQGAQYLKSNFSTKEELAQAMIKALGGTATVFMGVSGSTIESEIAFGQGVLGCNGLYNSFSLGPKVAFDTMPFGFKNQLIFGSINFRQDHMQKAIDILCKSNYDEIVELIDKDVFTADPVDAYQNKIYSKNSPMKTAVIWNDQYVDFTK